MGTSSGHGHSIPTYMMRAFAFVLLAVASAYAEADADAYTIGQVNHGFTHGGIITGVDYGHGAVSGFGAIGNRGIYGVYGKREAEADPYYYGGYGGYYGGYGHGYYPYSYGHFGVYGKRDADAEAEPYLYATGGGLSTYGHPVVSTVA